MLGLSFTVIVSTVCSHRDQDTTVDLTLFCSADYLLQSGLASQVRFHGKRFAWFVSDVTKKDWNWLLNTMVYGQLFPHASETELESLRRLGKRWKVRNAVSDANMNLYGFFCSDMWKRASGCMSSIRFGVRDIHTCVWLN